MTDQEKKQEIEDFDLSNHIYENYLYSGKEADAVADLLKQNTDIAYEFCSSEEDDLYLMENEPCICASFSAQKIVDDTGCSRVAAYAMMARMAQYPEEQPSIRELLGNKLPSFLLQPPLLSNTKRITKSYTMSTSVRLG